jgi:hypothetical protein
MQFLKPRVGAARSDATMILGESDDERTAAWSPRASASLNAGDVARADTRLEAHGIHAGEDALVDRSPDGVEQLVERVARSSQRRLRPEEEEQPVAAHSLLTRSREHRQQRQPAPMMAVRAEDRSVVWSGERERAEGGQAKASGEWR